MEIKVCITKKFSLSWPAKRTQQWFLLCEQSWIYFLKQSSKQKLEKKAFFIPTPGQYEQEYLAKKLKEEGLVPYAKQDDFGIENLKEIENYKGLPLIETPINWNNLFEVFENKNAKQ